jgi:transposase
VRVCARCVQEYCISCGKHLSRSLVHSRHRYHAECQPKPTSSSSASESPPPPPPPTLLFDHQPSSHQPLTEVERAAAITLRKLGMTQSAAAELIPCTRQTVSHWEHTYSETGNVHEAARSGRPHLTSELEDTALVMASTVDHYDTPRRLKRKFEVDVSPRTLDRRLIEAGLPGRVAVHAKKFTDEEKRKRLSFAEGYKSWTEEQWDRVLFSDEKIFYGKGFCGRVYVRRPPGQALNPEYCVDKKPHPVKVHMWGCFTGRGLGYCYIFNETLDAKLLKRILSTHLLPSAHLYYRTDPPEQWWFLQDNDPKHTSREIRNWLHNNGISCLDFPPYSPDLNPTENFWNDLARRVEVREPATTEQLQDIVAEEWAATSTVLLAKLAHSMPKRCKAVIEAKGGHTKY